MFQMACGCWPDGRPGCTRSFRSGRERPGTPLDCWCSPDLSSSCLRPCTPSLLLVHREVVNIDRADTGGLCVLEGLLDDSNLHCNLLSNAGTLRASDQPPR